MGIKCTVTSDRKRKRRKFTSAKKLENFLQRQLVLEARRDITEGVRRKMEGRMRTVQKRIGRITSKSNPMKGEVTIRVPLQIPNPGDIRPDTIWAAQQESWLRGDKVVLEIPEGFLYKIHDELGEKAKELQEEMGKRNTKAIKQVQEKLHDSVRKVLKSDKQYHNKRRKVLDKVVKDLSLADV